MSMVVDEVSEPGSDPAAVRAALRRVRPPEAELAVIRDLIRSFAETKRQLARMAEVPSSPGSEEIKLRVLQVLSDDIRCWLARIKPRRPLLCDGVLLHYNPSLSPAHLLPLEEAWDISRPEPAQVTPWPPPEDETPF